MFSMCTCTYGVFLNCAWFALYKANAMKKIELYLNSVIIIGDNWID